MRYFLFSIVGLLITGCDCGINTRATVVDSDTKLPLKDAEVRLIEIKSSGKERLDNTYYTDSNGYFEIQAITNHDEKGFGKCASLKLEIIKEDYLILRVSGREDNDTIFLTHQ